jgi:hypothetical protein
MANVILFDSVNSLCQARGLEGFFVKIIRFQEPWSELVIYLHCGSNNLINFVFIDQPGHNYMKINRGY